MGFDTIRSVVLLKNDNAPCEYTYEYQLPDGYKLIDESKYGNEDNKDGKGVIYVVNAENEIVNVIEVCPAVDAAGEKVSVDYSVFDTTIKANVNLPKNANYPIAVPLSDHPNRTKTSYMTKSQVLSVRNKFKTSTKEAGFTFLITSVLNFVKNISIVGTAWSTISYMSTVYNSKSFDTWDEIYRKFKKKYAKIDAGYKWHKGHRSYYPTGRLKCTYVASKS